MAAARKVYGVFLPNPTQSRFAWRWGITFNKSEALKEAKKKNATVRAMSKGLYEDGGTWDAPTFRAQSKQIYPE